MSMRTAGRASRKAIKGTRLCPPAMILACSPAEPSSSRASSRRCALWYWKDAGFNLLLASRAPSCRGLGTYDIQLEEASPTDEEPHRCEAVSTRGAHWPGGHGLMTARMHHDGKTRRVRKVGRRATRERHQQERGGGLSASGPNCRRDVPAWDAASSTRDRRSVRSKPDSR